jgi:hypothetical protein
MTPTLTSAAPGRLKLAVNPLLIDAPIATHENPRHLRAAKSREFRANMKLENAAKAFAKIPKRGEALHLICNGNFAAWNVVPAIMKLTGAAIRRLDVSTLGFNRDNIFEMAALLDRGQIGELWLIYSHYFRQTSSDLAEEMILQMNDRPAAHLGVIRTHAKIILIETARGEYLTLETSANLRSCKCLEQYTLINDRDLLTFHRGWIERAIKAAERTQAK